ncbi:hypothetical protein RND64_14300 [Gordonia sp. w5E2]|uniref:DUF1648 domain-containing protein n=1 Tax=Gordonia jacobaea TaxID=122202 RepID=A0ABR5IEQ8_9ACTN|nr:MULTISPECIES: hypothetical protein [Gordonia]KNA92060.1 hypothetical protein ABW18_07810 [Gordonia jacobaea]
MNHPSSQRRSGRVAAVLLGTLPSIAVLAVALVLLRIWRAELPKEIATHWNSHGVDGTMSVIGVVASVVVIAVLGAVLGGAAGWFIRDGRLLRLALALVNGLTVFMVLGIVGSVGSQRGTATVYEIGVPAIELAVAGVIGLVVGLITAALVRPTQQAAPVPVGELPMAELAVGERFLWQRRVSTSAGSLVVLGLVLVSIVMLAVLLREPWLLLPGVIAALAGAILWSARVTVDRERIAVRGVVGWPRMTVPMSDVVRAEVTQVNALRDFGGYGERLCVHGRLRGVRGIVLRSGSALLITRTDGSRQLVVVPDAQQAAGLVNASLAQASSHR